MSAAELPHDLDDHLVDVLAPDGAPTEDDIVAVEARGEEAGDAWERVGGWQPDDEGAADWVARKARRAAEELAAKQAQRDRIVAQADAWLEKERRRPAATIAWAEGVLGEWLRRQIAADPDGKVSRNLPSGVTVKRTGGAMSLQVDDEKALVDWLAENAEGLVQAETVWNWSKADVKKTFTAETPGEDGIARLVGDGGETIPGVHLQRGSYNFQLDLPGGGS